MNPHIPKYIVDCELLYPKWNCQHSTNSSLTLLILNSFYKITTRLAIGTTINCTQHITDANTNTLKCWNSSKELTSSKHMFVIYTNQLKRSNSRHNCKDIKISSQINYLVGEMYKILHLPYLSIKLYCD
jgi:hypothetical protein